MSGTKFIQQAKAAGYGGLPIVVHTGRELPKDEIEEIQP